MKASESLRAKRSVSHKTLEVAMIADPFMTERYGEEALPNHMLMLAHIVSGLSCDIV